ncbi:MAG TPA: DNA translocase FtsK [Candidatus Latescibacteria bacterium]|nr:DNA translocase FtsK [Candidatus Latescibacterota bacterium]
MTSKSNLRRSRWASGLVLIGLGAFLGLSFLSWTTEDAGLPPGQVRNWGGVAGARLARWGFGLFGYGVWLTPVLAFVWGWRLLRGLLLRRLALRSAGWGVLVVLLDTLAARVSPRWGGRVGALLNSRVFYPYLGRIGSLLALGVLLVALVPFLVKFPKLPRARRPRPLKKPAKKPARRPAEPRPEPPPEEGRPEVEESNASDGGYRPPPISLLSPPKGLGRPEERILKEGARRIEELLADFGIEGKVVRAHPGPVVTLYEVEPGSGVKVSRIAALADDLARGMKASRIRVQAPIPGTGTVGVEVPNPKPSVVYFREVVESEAFRSPTSPLTLGLGVDISGEPFCADLARMPHLLIAGATGSGKSTCLNTIIASVLFKAGPRDVRFLMIDPKMLELSPYNDIPHLLTPVLTQPRRAAEALRWAVGEMERRYQVLARHTVRHIADFRRKASGEEQMPYIVVVVDELADLMLVLGPEIEDSLARLAQMARAVGIHLVVATQRPSVDVITGVIKANFPSRIAFQVASKVDSRTVLDRHGAEKLLGRGDMLFLPPGSPEPVRLHGAYISDEEVEGIVKWVKGQGPRLPQLEFPEEGPQEAGDWDPLFGKAVRLVVLHGQASASFLQRRLKIGYARAGRLMDQLEAAGVVGPPVEGGRPREVLVGEEYIEQLGGEGEGDKG